MKTVHETFIKVSKNFDAFYTSQWLPKEGQQKVLIFSCLFQLKCFEYYVAFHNKLLYLRWVIGLMLSCYSKLYLAKDDKKLNIRYILVSTLRTFIFYHGTKIGTV